MAGRPAARITKTRSNRFSYSALPARIAAVTSGSASPTAACSRCGEVGVVAGAGLLADPWVPGQRRCDLGVGERCRRRPGPVQDLGAVAYGRPPATSSHPAGHVQAGCQRRRCLGVGHRVEPLQTGGLLGPRTGPRCAGDNGRRGIILAALAPRIGLASATRSSNRWLAILATSMTAAANSWVGAFCMRSQPDFRIWSRFSTSRTETISGMPNRSR